MLQRDNRKKHTKHLLSLHEIELRIAVKPEGHLAKMRKKMNKLLGAIKDWHLVEHVKLEGECHEVMRVSRVELAPFQQEVLLQKMVSERSRVKRPTLLTLMM